MSSHTSPIFPEQTADPTLREMQTGDRAFTSWGAVWIDEERRVWLDPDCLALRRPEGRVDMQVELRDDGFHLWVPRGLKRQPVSGAGRPGLPVVKLH